MFKPFDPKQTLPQSEEEVLSFWQQHGIFNESVEQRQGKEPFVFYEGPPTANGKPGIHHVLARTFKDVICRYQAMKGKYVLRKAGWDTHGLPVELQVERALGLKNKAEIEAFGIAEFNKRCRESVWQYKEDWEKLTDRMGYWTDMSQPYITYDRNYIESVWWAVSEIWKKGYMYQAHKVVPYCYRCGTSLSLAEVAQGYKSVADTSVFLKFKLTDFKLAGQTGDVFILAWTTTPWTLPGNVALALGPEVSYVAVKNPAVNETYILAEARIEPLKKAKILPADIEVLQNVSLSDLVNQSYVPLFPGAVTANDKAYKLYEADFVTTEDGTGVVHTAVMYGEDDYNLGVKVGLPTQHTVTEEGVFADNLAHGLAGLKVKDPETEKSIIGHLKSNNMLLAIQSYTHDYPFCWRCDTPLLYYARNSWFIRIDDALRKRLVEFNNDITWTPEYVKYGRFGKWLEGLRDWAISRERYWGTPLPIWICEANHDHKQVIDGLATLRSMATPDSQVKVAADGIDLHKPFIDDIELTCPECDGVMKRVPEVLDVWFDSGSMPFAQWHYPFENEAKFKQQFPADYIAEGNDQTRGWFNSLLIISTLLFDEKAYKSVITPNLVLDENGQKMSKSRGNVVDPFEVMSELGADAARFYFLSVNRPGDNKNFSKKAVLEVQRKNILIWWNVVSFFLTYASVDNWQPGQTGQPTVLDNWITARLQETVAKVDESLAVEDTFTAARAFQSYIDDLSTWYLRRSRKRRDAAFYSTLHAVLIETAKLAAPFMPFTAEATYLRLKTDDMPASVHLCDYPVVDALDAASLSTMAAVRELVTLGHAVRMETKLKVRQPLATAFYQGLELNQEYEEILCDELNVKAVNKVDDVSRQGVAKLSPDQNLGIAIDTQLTPELIEEGTVRELIREFQALRKQSGCRPGEMVSFYFRTDDANLQQILEKYRVSLLEEVSGISLEPFGGEAPVNITQVEINSASLEIGLANAQ